MAAGNTAAPQKKKGILMPILVLLPLALLLLPATIVLACAMVPTMVARIVDPWPGRYLTISVGCLNFAGSLWFMYELWTGGASLAAIWPTLGSMFGWLSALVGAGVGWAIYSTMPVITRSIVVTKSNLRLRGVRKDQEELVEQWGEAVREGASR
jgi:hypothetical protein